MVFSAVLFEVNTSVVLVMSFVGLVISVIVVWVLMSHVVPGLLRFLLEFPFIWFDN